MACKTQISLPTLFVVLIPTVACMTEAPEIEMGADTDTDPGVSEDPNSNAACYLQDDSTYQDGVVQWCNGEYEFDLDFDFNSLIGGNSAQSYSSQVQTTNDSTYDKPLVAACCTDVTDVPGWAPGDDTCALPHHEACYSDLVQQICNAIPAALADFKSQNALNGDGVIEEARVWFKENRQACYDHFWEGSDNLKGADYCASEFDVFYDHPNWEPGFSASNNLASTSIGNFSISLKSKLRDSVILTDHQEPLESCSGPVDNDGVLPPFSELVPGSIKAFATSNVGLDVSGPKWNGEVISGTADASSESWVGFRAGATDLTLDGWSMVEAASANIGTSTVSSKVRKFEVRLVGQHVAPDDGRYFVLAKDEALFALGGVVDNESDYVTTKNSSAIEFYIRRPGSKGCPSATESCLVNKPFRLTYEDMLGQTWEVDVASMTWAP